MSGQQEFVEALFASTRICPDGLVAWNGSDPTVRFGVYRNNVIVSLIDALADTYPVTQELVGETFFRAMARLFVVSEPPHSRVLAFYGESLPVFIDNFPPAASVPYLADMARLEMLRVRAYHANDASEITADMMTPMLADANASSDFEVKLHPSAALLRSHYAVCSLWVAHQGLTDISAVDPDIPESVLVIRSGLNVSIVHLRENAHSFIAHLLRGERLGTAAGLTLEIHPDFDLVQTLGLLLAHRAISTINRQKHLCNQNKP